MSKKSENLKNACSLVGVGAAIGTAIFASTNEPTFIAVGVAVGAALSWRKPKNKTLPMALFFILSFIPITSIAQDNPSISIELLSYEQKVSSYDEVPYCEISYIITNNSWGTLYGIRVETEAYDDRGTKLDDYGLGGKFINPFSGWFDSQVLIRKGDKKQLNNLEYSGVCNYIKTINAINVAPEDCNARMMPEDGSCFDVLSLRSSIDHISFQKK